MKVGILGFAHGHVDMYCVEWGKHADMGVTVAAGWDHDTSRAKAAAERHGVALADSPGALVSDAAIEAVVIGAETSMHAELVEAAAAAGKPIVLQKPMALTMDEADRIVAAVEDSGVPFTMAWQMRVDPENLKIRELVKSGRLGRIFMVRRRHGLTTHRWAGFEDLWHNKAEYNRDIFADDAAHPADFVYWLLGMPETVVAELGTLQNPRVPNDNAIAVFRYADGTFAEVVCSFVCVTHENTTEIVAERGTIIQNFGDGPSSGAPRPEGKGKRGLKWFIEDKGEWEDSEDYGISGQGDRIAGLAGPIGEFLRGKRGPIATAREGRDVLGMILACYESNESGKRVRL